MARSQTPQGSLRQRTPAAQIKKSDEASFNPEPELDKLAKAAAQRNAATGSEIEYYLGFAVMTVLGFITRFWGITHPNEVVFDEVHFGKVCQ
jgi:dolichyl-phosphate-mannose-protein mannosyltransferase